MRADSHHVLENLAESCRDESKPHQCPEENWEDAELKISENGKNNNNVCELFYDTRSGEGWENKTDENKLECHSCGDSDGTGKKIRSNNHDFASIGDSLEKVDPIFFMDKNVTACDLPEVVVCYKENTYHVVKDICVDEGVPIHEKFLFGEKDSVKCSSNSHQCGSEALMKADKVNVNPTETKSLEDIKSKVDDPKTYQDLEESSREYFSDAETSSNCNQEDLTVTDSPMHALNPSEISELDDNLKDQVATSKSVLKESLTLGDILSREEEQNSLINSNNIDRLEEETSPQLQDEESRCLETTPFETEFEETEESKKAEQNLSSVSTTISQEPNKTGKDPENSETETKQQNNLVGDSYEDDKLFASSFGETSFCVAEPVSGHITYSGPIAFSGSLSVRSDASTTSGRSFAFPILQSEWNSSPVRMAKADKRRQKGWRNSLLCCRFS